MSFFQISTSSTDQIFATMAGLFDSLLPLLLVIIGLAIGLWILDLIVGIFSNQNTDDWYEHDSLLTEADRKYYRKTRGAKK